MCKNVGFVCLLFSALQRIALKCHRWYSASVNKCSSVIVDKGNSGTFGISTIVSEVMKIRSCRRLTCIVKGNCFSKMLRSQSRWAATFKARIFRAKFRWLHLWGTPFVFPSMISGSITAASLSLNSEFIVVNLIMSSAAEGSGMFYTSMWYTMKRKTSKILA